jgi:hypothetical protein
MCFHLLPTFTAMQNLLVAAINIGIAAIAATARFFSSRSLRWPWVPP